MTDTIYELWTPLGAGKWRKVHETLFKWLAVDVALENGYAIHEVAADQAREPTGAEYTETPT